MKLTTEPPHELPPNPLLARHGATGGLILKLHRYALLGWLAFFLVSGVFVAYVFTARLSPTPVVAVDAGGRLLGHVEYLNPASRTDAELTASAQYFLDRYLSLNSVTIYDDYAGALNMMGEELRAQKIAELKQSGYLTQVDKAKSRSYLEYTNGEQAPHVIARRDLHSSVRLKGRMVIVMDASEVERPFDLTLDMTHVARSSLSTQGVQIDAIHNN